MSVQHRDIEETKRCPKCGLHLPLTREFWNKNAAACRHKTASYCRKCLKVYRRERVALRPHVYRASHMKRGYGLTLDEFDALLAKQGGVCAVCGTADPAGRGQFCVDHEHDTGRIRGLLCGRCNSGLGYFQDSSEALRAAADYLEGAAL